MSSDMALEIYLKGVENGTVENHCCVVSCGIVIFFQNHNGEP